jgi:hypothetical protein
MVVIFLAHFLNYIAILVFADTAWFKSDPIGFHETFFGPPPQNQIDDYNISWFENDG